MKLILKKIVVAILQFESKLVLKKYKPKIVAVTGSVGKTSTKDALYTALSAFYHVRKTHKSYNSDIGIPLTVLGCQNGWSDFGVWSKNILIGAKLILFKQKYPEVLILEVGADRPGDIYKIMQWIKPDVSVLTRIGKVPVHVEFYKSVSEVVKEKSWLVKCLKKDGLLVINADDTDILAMRKLTTAKAITYGIENDADLKGTFISPLYKDGEGVYGMSLKVDVSGNSIPVMLKGSIGNQHAYPVLAALSVLSGLEKNLLEGANAFSKYLPPEGRMRILDGINNSKIIDDTYNASPVAMEEGLKLLEKLEATGKKIAILGDMLELGRYSLSEHERMGEIASKSADIIIATGLRSKDLGESAIDAGTKRKNVYFVENSEEAGKIAESLINNGDLIYAKGSQGIRLEKALKFVLNDKEEASTLLVRQEKEWLKR